MAEQENGSSPLAEALARVGDRWTLLVVEALLGGPQRFNDLLGQIPGIAPNILSERLNRLEREGLLIARPYSERPPRAACQLTAEGTELAGALRLLAHWRATHADPAEAPAPRVRHPSRGPLVLPDLRPPRRPRAPRRRGQLPVTPEPAGPPRTLSSPESSPHTLRSPLRASCMMAA
jgi:DNA-binding HxlR family transcriptional regulator